MIQRRPPEIRGAGVEVTRLIWQAPREMRDQFEYECWYRQASAALAREAEIEAKLSELAYGSIAWWLILKRLDRIRKELLALKAV